MPLAVAAEQEAPHRGQADTVGTVLGHHQGTAVARRMSVDISETATMCVDITEDGEPACDFTSMVMLQIVPTVRRLPPEGQLWIAPVLTKGCATVGFCGRSRDE